MELDYEKTFFEGSKESIPPGKVCDRPVVVLIADDDPVSRRILSRSLHQAEYEVVTVTDGNDARDILLSERPPDIALLDWVMPGKSGTELCRIIANEVSHFVYTVLITAKADSNDLIEGLQSGAHEFLTKPINVAEFNVRMSAAVRFLKYERELLKKNREIARYAHIMEELANTRAKQLVHAERLATLGMLSAGIGHEIKNPVAYVSGNIQILNRYKTEILAAINYSLESGNGNASRLKLIQDNLPEILNAAKEGLTRITSILSGLSKFAHRGNSTRVHAPIEQCISDAIELSRNKWKYHVTVNTDCDELPAIEVNPQEITQVVVNLMVNASDAMRDRDDGIDSIIDVSLKPNGQYQRIVVADNGPGIPDEMSDRIWNPFFTTKPSGEGTGLGLAICSGIVEEHGGEIFFKNLPTGGACFVIDLPVIDFRVSLNPATFI
ncbi:MAG: response regulator [Deltaproteobacteria bacterium]|nr:response regulator [Deltaproteobacteria bacterium]